MRLVEETSAEEEQIVLEYWSMWNEPEPQALWPFRSGLMPLRKQNPNITINATWNGRENQTKLRSALAAGTVVDFMDQDADQVAGGLMAEGLGYPLDDFLQQTALDACWQRSRYLCTWCTWTCTN